MPHQLSHNLHLLAIRFEQHYERMAERVLTWRPATAYHSYRRASTGSRFAAREAGISALSTPTSSNTRVEIMTVKKEIFRWMSALPESSSKSGPISGSVPTAIATT